MYLSQQHYIKSLAMIIALAGGCGETNYKYITDILANIKNFFLAVYQGWDATDISTPGISSQLALVNSQECVEEEGCNEEIEANLFNQGYGFLECTSSFAAQNIMAKYNQKRIPNTNRTFKLNWASYSSGKADNDYALYVGDLPSMVTDTILFQTFFAKFPSCKHAKVITDPQTGQSKNYGFVHFNTPEGFKSAIVRMNGQLCMGQPMRIRAATSTKRNAEMRGERELAEIESLVASQGGTVGYQFGEGRD
ncbi:MAG: putative Polyadenylate-binding protein RBP45C, partial [Streblomastix strix]